jgi:hypothetical protein
MAFLTIAIGADLHSDYVMHLSIEMESMVRVPLLVVRRKEFLQLLHKLCEPAFHETILI